MIMDCVYCGEPLTIDDLARHDCGRADELTDLTIDGVCELYQRLVVQPYVTLDDAFRSTFHDEHKRDENLRQALSYLVTGPPLSTTTSAPRHALTHRHAQLFMAAATATLMRVKKSSSDDDDYLHYRQPPLGYTLLAAVCRQATRAEHVVPLLAALSLPTVTPHLTLDENCWHRYDEVILSDVSIVSNPQLLKALGQAIEKITFVRDDAADGYDALKVSSSFLWKDKDEFIVSVLHVILLSLMGGGDGSGNGGGVAVALPPLSQSDAGSWLPRLAQLVAHALDRSERDPAFEVAKALDQVKSNPLISFTTTRLARAFPIALEMKMGDCVRCGNIVPRDCTVQLGRPELCKVCYEVTAIEFENSGGEQKNFEENSRHHALTIKNFHTIIRKDIKDRVTRLIADKEENKNFDKRFHCPLNASHQNPFHAPMPEHLTSSISGAPVGVTCPECSIKWCSQCRFAYHPYSRSCKEVLCAKLEWATFSDVLKNSANTALCDFDSEVSAFKLASTDRPAAIARRRDRVTHEIRRIEACIVMNDKEIQQIQQTNRNEMNWDGDTGNPPVMGSRRCPHCGRQPIRRLAGCSVVVCGSNMHGGGNFQGGCLRQFNYASPEATYQPMSTTRQEDERRELETALSKLVNLKKSLDDQSTTTFPSPALADHWPTLSCSGCKKKLLGGFHVQCYHCEPPFLLCMHCVRSGKHNDHAKHGDAGHVFARVICSSH